MNHLHICVALTLIVFINEVSGGYYIRYYGFDGSCKRHRGGCYGVCEDIQCLCGITPPCHCKNKKSKNYTFTREVNNEEDGTCKWGEGISGCISYCGNTRCVCGSTPNEKEHNVCKCWID